jgi:hypothetical protein
VLDRWRAKLWLSFVVAHRSGRRQTTISSKVGVDLLASLLEQDANDRIVGNDRGVQLGRAHGWIGEILLTLSLLNRPDDGLLRRRPATATEALGGRWSLCSAARTPGTLVRGLP